ncbi:hypothetical protein [Amphritea sp. HPY]|uniref:hypothetical protein n=1 Tax=Amphritea sp. HPY TaxID=3421652 RepID=UPI003D7CA0C6
MSQSSETSDLTSAVDLPLENQQYSGTGGVSQANNQHSFSPAFMDQTSGDIEISRFGNGNPAPFHSLDGLPDSWITERNIAGRVVSIKSSVVSGFVRLEEFFTREEAAVFVEQYL